MSNRKPGKFPKGIEVVGSAIIEDSKGRILMTRSPKWNNKWVMPGGHVEPGEGLIDAQLREGREETGLVLKPIEIVSYGELINPRNFYRPVHMIYFDLYCKVARGKLRLQRRELSEHAWVTPREALKLDLADSYDRTIRDFIRYKKRKG